MDIFVVEGDIEVIHENIKKGAKKHYLIFLKKDKILIKNLSKILSAKLYCVQEL